MECIINYCVLNVTGERVNVPQMAQKVDDALRKSSRVFVVQDIVCSRRDPSGRNAVDRMEERMQYKKFSPHKLDFVLFSWHGRGGWEHFHVYHSCSYRKSYCSCSFLKTQNIIPARRRTLRISELGQKDIQSIIEYNTKAGQQVHLFAVEGLRWQFLGHTSSTSSQSSLHEGQLEECDNTLSNIPGSGRPRASATIGRFYGAHSKSDDNEGRSGKEDWIECVNKFVNNYVTIPIKNAFMFE